MQHFLPGQADGALGQTLEDDVVQFPVLDQGERGIDPVAGEACAAADTNFFHGIRVLSSGVAFYRIRPKTVSRMSRTMDRGQTNLMV